MSRIKWRRDSDFVLTAVFPDGKEWTFSRPGKSYVFCDFGNAHKSGTLGTQICYGGGTSGNTVYANSEAEFEKSVKDWWRDCRKNSPDIFD